MIRQEQIAVVIDTQKESFKDKPGDLMRDALNKVPVINSFATIVTGIRRCGKSTLVLQTLNRGPYEPYILVNFDDIRLAGFDVNDFVRLYNEIIARGVRVVFFDEIQLVEKWEMFIHQLLREGFTVFITGSNASLLSKELGTHLTGRHVSMELFPFSYNEYVRFTKQESNEESLWKYMRTGGIPEYVKNPEPMILNNLIEDIVIRDIAVRNNIRDVDSLRQLAVYLLSNVGNRVSANKLVGMFGIKSSATILDYFSFYRNAYLVEMIPQFSYSVKVQARNPKKIYAMDLGLIDVVATSFTGNEGHKLENMIYLYLRQNYKEIYYFDDQGECDFVVVDKNIPQQAIQVCWEITDENFDREYHGLCLAMKKLNLSQGVIITRNQQDYFEQDNCKITMLPAYEFMK